MNRRPLHFVLNADHSVRPVDVSTDDGLAEWCESWGSDRRVAFDELGPGVEVSTVFLGIDHAFGSGPPMLFETMTFDDYGDGDQRRYSTWDQAVAGHAAAVAKLKAKLAERVKVKPRP